LEKEPHGNADLTPKGCDRWLFRLTLGANLGERAAPREHEKHQDMAQKALVFEVSQEEDGTWVAAGIGDDIFTQGANLDELKANITEAVLVHFAGEYYHDFVVRLDKVLSQFTVAA
jgi:predicted RNase H-like HicB family nuclease